MSEHTGTINLGLTIIKGRRSIRKYKDTPVEEHIIMSTLEAARLAPTARNVQPWLIGVVREKERLAKLSELVQTGRFIKNAAVCFAVFAKKDHKFYVEDGSAATMQIIMALQSFGVGTCWVAGDKMPHAPEVQKLLNVPDAYTLVSLIPAGYPAEVTVPSKKELDEIYFMEEYKEE